MTFESIFAFVLVLVAASVGVLAWNIFDLRAQSRAMASWRSTYESYAKSLREKLDAARRESPVELAARVVELGDAVARLAKTQQRFQGRFDQYVNPDARPDNSPPTLDRDALRRANAEAIMPAGIRK